MMTASPMPARGPVLSVRDLCIGLPTGRESVDIVRSIGFDVAEGEILGLVGESGSGKSLTLRAIMRLLPPRIRTTGRVLWKGRDILTAGERELRRLRGAEISMIFQEPMTALNPVLSIGRHIDESLRAHTTLTKPERRRRAVELLDLVGIPAPQRRLSDYPFQFSGGMRQRAMIAIALACNPTLLLADEPTTALDVTIQDQILELLLRLRDELGLSVILVTHDLGVVSEICNRTAIMYAGEIVETAETQAGLTAPRHPYTHGLLQSIPRADDRGEALHAIPGQPPLLGARPPGCAFAPRCAFVRPDCDRSHPVLRALDGGREAACLFPLTPCKEGKTA